MELNLTIEVITGSLVVFILLGMLILSYLKLRHAQMKSLFFIRLSWLFMAMFFLVEVFSDLFLNVFLARLYNLFLIPMVFFYLIGINYSKKESVYSVSLIILLLLVPIFCILAFSPNSLVIIAVSGFNYLKIVSAGLFDVFVSLFTLISTILPAYWGILIWRNTPFLYKKEAFLLVLGTSILTAFAMIIYLLVFVHPSFVMLSDLILVIAGCFVIYAITKEPKLLYILPFSVNRIVVKDHDGHPIFSHDWSESRINEKIFTGFINAVQIMSEEVMNIGGLLDINLQEGILIVYNSKFVTIGLVASKSSTLLRDCLRNFTHDFEIQFEHLLKTSSKDIKKYESAYLLIDKHFSNFPYRIIQDKRHPLLISAKTGKLPLQIDDKFYQIFKDDEELEEIKAELIRSSIDSHDNFLNLYEELKDDKEVFEENED